MQFGMFCQLKHELFAMEYNLHTTQMQNLKLLVRQPVCATVSAYGNNCLVKAYDPIIFIHM